MKLPAPRSRESKADGALPQRWRFHPIANVRAHQEVVQQLAFAILAGAYAPGEKLPGIDALSRMMGVSKPVIGEALKILAEDGTIRVQRGINGGLTVGRSDISETIAVLGAPLAHLSPRAVVEARRPIELAISLLAAERADAADYAMLQDCIDRLREHRRSRMAVRIRYDHLFHYTLGRAARSEALALYQHQILEKLLASMQPYFATIEDVDSVIALHETTLAAVRSGDRATIERAIDEHLRPLEAVVLGSESAADIWKVDDKVA